MKEVISFCSFVFLYCLVHLANGVHVFDVYRMLQYDKLGASFGSQRSSLNSLAVTVHTLPQIESLARYVIMVQAEELTVTLVEELINKRNADGMVVLTPNKEEAHLINMEKWLEVERALVQQKVDGAIYFAYRDENTIKFYEELSKEITSTGATSWIDIDSYRFEVLPPEAAPINEIKVHNIQGWLAGASKGTGDSLPTIAIVASYDSFGIAPSLATGVDSNGSGVVALLELARLFSRLYRGSKTQGEYNILFLLTGAGRMNFVDTSLWLEADPRLVESIEFAICVDTIGTGQALKMHVSRSDKDAKAKQVYDAFSAIATEMNIPFEIVHKKINISSQEVPWQHEQFSKKRVLAATLSNLEKPMPHMTRSNIFDAQLDLDIFSRNIKFIAEGLSRYIYNLNKPNISIFADDLALSSDFVSSWVNVISRYPRMMPYLAYATKGKDQKENILITGLEKELAKHVADVSKKTVILSKEDAQDYVFYDKIASIMSAYRGKPVSFDIILSVFVCVYLLVLYTILKGPRNTWLQFLQIFAGSKKKRAKTQ